MRTCRRAARAGPLVLLLVLSTLVASVGAVFIDFNNCLDPNIIHSEPRQLQFIPHFVSARFNTSDPSHNLNVTIYGNVSGQATQGTLPSPLNTTYWNNPNETFGKIVDLSTSNNKYTTLFSKFQVVTYTPYDAEPSRFCLATVNTSCPIAPVFEDVQDPYGLSIFTVAHDFYSSYAFASFAATIRVQSGDSGAPDLACISATITPDLGGALSDALRYLPAAILALVAVATIFAAIFSPWGSSDPFRWTSNYGRDEDLLRLVTPGFGDCLQYVQFIVLAGSLNLAYPGFYQPVISQAAWSTLLFNESFVTPGNSSYNSLVDGIYVTNSTYGLSRLGQLVGMDKDQDIWAAFAVWFLGITVAAVLLCQIGFVIKWAYRFISHTQEEDLRSKNLPFSTGVVVRMTFNYFLLPIVSISLFQLVVASRSPASVVAMAVFLLIVVIGLAAWIFRLIFTTKPRAHLFDDLPTVLTYGPLYNTYSDDAAPFAFIPVLLTFIRGVAIGAIQPSGIAQLIILAICEVIYILTLHAFRPFQAPTSMNAYHTFFSVVRLLTTLLSVAFVPNLDVAESSKGWLGYAILLLHAIVLVFGFFLNSIQTIVEVSARMAGAGDARGGLTKVFGKRQLSRRTHRRGQRSSLNSNAGMLGDGDSKSIQLMGGRSRSLSASSAVLLARQAGMDGRMSGGFEHFSQGGDPSNYGGTSPEPGTPGGSATPYTFLPSGSASAGASSRRPTMGTMAPKGLETTDPYYRPPRARRQTVDPYTPGARSRASWGNGDSSKAYEDAPESGDAGEGSSFSPHRGSITPAYLRGLRDDSDPNINEPRRPRTDYAVRESDFYYGVTRGPALASDGVPTRKLKTGPADPMGPMSSAGGWLKSLFGAKRKDKSKGFEVVRSTRAPQMLAVGEEEENAPDDHHHEPYQDNPDPRAHPDPPRAMSAYTRASSEDGRHPDPPRAMSAYTMASSDDGHIARPRRDSSDSSDSQESSEEENLIGEDGDIFHSGGPRVSDMAPTLGPIETGGGIELPSRIGSKASSKVSRMGSLSRPPTIPRKSSKRQSGHEATMFADTPRLSTISASPSEYATQEPPAAQEQHASGYLQPGAVPRLPFGSSKSSPSPERSAASSIGGEAGHSGSMRRHTGSQSTEGERPLSTGYVHQHKASESIQPGLYDPAVHMGSRAEFVQDPLGSRSTRRSEE
ncbi:uncharacterized protein K452DRAFT_290873 [Aplosporella prunicola CBS 121167]|uniref:ML-like domain-containing protein n=1 Tax=Aplosporella prunicola CBS 121167 TaxID=1176127 RepID=A0A6A6B4G0_9PEZI|nr:uncharacterized protein K452DRAFT_290873 [Aplosporella prunicola CBS 121167]KAF2138283.1 hypothetical protein K452DRAFT_290873 [Aplosporella prunicola CBS 121167]